MKNEIDLHAIFEELYVKWVEAALSLLFLIKC